VAPYSLTEYIAKAIWFSRWREGIFAVFSVYFDASGDESDKDVKHIAVSGFIAHADIWTEWEKDWLECLNRNEILNEKGLLEFHMSDCANYRYFFDGWRKRERERQCILHELIQIINGHLGRKASCIINVEDYKKYIDEDLRKAYGMTGAYVMGGRTCAARVKEWCRKEKVPALPDVQFFFEHGDGKELQANLKERFLDDDYPEPFFKRKRNKYSSTGELLERGLVPFQAADVLAYLTNLDAKFSNRDHWGEKENIRWMFNKLAPIPEPTCTFPPDHMLGMNTLMRVCLDL
jgi:hypothetical protein